MRVICTGGCGYVGSVLVPKLLSLGHSVHVIDLQWFGNYLKSAPYFSIDKADFRTADLPQADAIIHLANIANDPCGDLDGKLTWEVNALGTVQLVQAAIRKGIEHFIFASSASVYGLKDNEPVTEETSLEPVSDYNKTKMVAERILLSYADKMRIQIVRPATVCGLSPRMRLDVIVNMLTMQALETGKITVHCGPHGAELMRPHCHIEDMTDLYCWLLRHKELQGIYNAGFANLSVKELVTLIREIVAAEVSITETKDKRSYCVSSLKLCEAGFYPKHDVRKAICDIVQAYRESNLRREPQMVNLSWMQSQGLAGKS